MPGGSFTSQTLAVTGNTVASFTPPKGVRLITVINRTAADEVFITTSGTDPTVAGANTLYLPKVAGASVVVPISPNGGVIKFISTLATSLWIQV